jgi:AbrB family looped-hinge helix DNA binding protein
MPQFTIVSQTDTDSVVLPASLLESMGLHAGDRVEVTLIDGQLILRPADDPARGELLQKITGEVLEQRREAYRRLA